MNKTIKKILKSMYSIIGEWNTGLLISILADSIQYVTQEKGVKEIRNIEIKYNDFFTTKCNLSGEDTGEYKH